MYRLLSVPLLLPETPRFSHLQNSVRALTRVFSLTSPSGCIFQIRNMSPFESARVPLLNVYIFIYLFQLQRERERESAALYSMTFAKYLLAYLIRVHRGMPFENV